MVKLCGSLYHFFFYNKSCHFTTDFKLFNCFSLNKRLLRRQIKNKTILFITFYFNSIFTNKNFITFSS